jgi:hypothetical protein
MLKKSKIEKVKTRLMAGRPISQKSAIANFSLYRLSSVIHTLRGRGMDISTNMRNGFAIYRLVG